jgi:hypothetical protein
VTPRPNRQQQTAANSGRDKYEPGRDRQDGPPPYLHRRDEQGRERQQHPPARQPYDYRRDDQGRGRQLRPPTRQQYVDRRYDQRRNYQQRQPTRLPYDGRRDVQGRDHQQRPLNRRQPFDGRTDRQHPPDRQPNPPTRDEDQQLNPPAGQQDMPTETTASAHRPTTSAKTGSMDDRAASVDNDWTVPKRTVGVRRHSAPQSRPRTPINTNPFAPLQTEPPYRASGNADDGGRTAEPADATEVATAANEDQDDASTTYTDWDVCNSPTDTDRSSRRGTPTHFSPPPAPKPQRSMRCTSTTATTCDDRRPSKQETADRYAPDDRTFVPKVSRRRLPETCLQQSHVTRDILVIGDSNMRAWCGYPADWTVVQHSGYRIQDIAGLLSRSVEMLNDVRHVIVTAGMCNRQETEADIQDAAFELQQLQTSLNGRLHFAGVPSSDRMPQRLQQSTARINDYMRDAVGAENFLQPPDPSTTVFFNDDTHYARRTGRQMINVVRNFLETH